MSQPCPNCANELKYRQRRYMSGSYRAVNPTVLVTLDKWKCQGRAGCKHEFIIKTDYPLDSTLAPHQSLSYNFGQFNNAMSHKPGRPEGHTTVSQFTELACKNPASEYVRARILQYFKPQNDSFATA